MADKKEPKEKIVLTKITADMTDEELDKEIDAALDEIFGPEDDTEEKKEQLKAMAEAQLMAMLGEKLEDVPAIQADLKKMFAEKKLADEKEQPPPATDETDKESPNQDITMADKKDPRPQLHLARPADRSLEAFKEFINGMMDRLMPGQSDTFTDEKWADYHRRFWENFDKGIPPKAT